MHVDEDMHCTHAVCICITTTCMFTGRLSAVWQYLDATGNSDMEANMQRGESPYLHAMQTDVEGLSTLGHWLKLHRGPGNCCLVHKQCWNAAAMQQQQRSASTEPASHEM